MCGLFGAVFLDGRGWTPDLLARARQARDTLAHRGPDQWGERVDGPVYLGHRRLSIMDISDAGRQPMISGDGAVAITVNGEIYNFKSIRRDLDQSVFRSQSDSEVILHGYRSWGIDRLIERMDGIYAFAVFDRDARSVFLVRDRAGVKPLYYGVLGDCFVWASELKAIVAFFGADRLETDPTALYDFLTYRYVPTPKTPFKGIHKLRPGHALCLDFQTRSWREKSYWRLCPSSEPVDADIAGERLRTLFRASVEEQLMSDVPVGFFLSGGIDSSIVVANAAQLHPSPVTFSIGFDDKAHDETAYAHIVAQHFKTEQKTEVVSVKDAGGLLDRMSAWYDEPFADTSALPTYHVSSFARQHSVVVLTGDGGDELFGGYRWYRNHQRVRRMQAPLRPFASLLPPLSLTRRASGQWRRPALWLDRISRTDPIELHATLLGGLARHEKSAFRDALEISADYDDYWYFRQYWRPELGACKSLQYLDFLTYLPDDILTKVDRASMAVSLEARVPFLSRDIIEYAFSLPESFLYLSGELKGGLKHAFRGILPAEIIERGKRGFSIPIDGWRSGILGTHATVQEAIVARWLKKSPIASEAA